MWTHRTVSTAIGILAAGALTLGACVVSPPRSADTTVAPTAPPSSGPTTTTTWVAPGVLEQDDPDVATALFQLRENADGDVVRWARSTVTVRTEGSPTPTDLRILRNAMDELDDIPGVPRLVLSSDDADITLHFIPKDEWSTVVERAEDFTHADGVAWYERVPGTAEIERSTIAVDADSVQTQRNRTIVHELLHGLGLGHHRCPTALLYGDDDYTPEWDLDPYDLEIVTAWYADHDGLPTPGRNLPCPAPEWDAVLVDDALVWCAVDDTPCYAVDPDMGVLIDQGPVAWRSGDRISSYDPSRYLAFSYEGQRVLCQTTSAVDQIAECQRTEASTITSVDLWFDGRVVYDYDPRIYEIFRYEGQRVLCERYPTDRRRPCQITDGSVLTAIDFYTDGERLYDTP